MKRTSVLALVAMVAGIIIGGCSQSSTGPSAPSTADLIGKWIFSSVIMKGTTTIHLGITGVPDSTYQTDTTITFSGTANYAQLYADMTYATQMPGMASTGAPVSDTGTWSLSGSSLRLISVSNDTTNLSVSVSGKNGTFVNVTSQRLNNPTGILPGSYYQIAMTTTMSALKQ